MADETGDGERPLWELSRDEQRVLLITFAGGLASIVIGAAMVGSAIAYAKWQAAKHPPGNLADTLLAVVVVLGLLYGATRIRRLPSWLRWGLRTVIVLLAGTALLWLVGVAAKLQ